MSTTAPVIARTPLPFSPFDPRRFDHLSEGEVLRRIGALLATALARSGRLRRGAVATSGDAVTTVAAPVDPVELIRDPVARRVAHFLRMSGPATPGELAATLEIKRRTLARKLHLLRTGGLCVVTGQTRNARYAVRTDFAAN
jgi:hypothetical protein